MNTVILNAFFPGEPVTWKRAQAHGRRRFNPKHMKAAQDKLRWQLKTMVRKIKPDAISRFGIQMIFHVSHRGDGSNFQKLLEDAFNGWIWKDDEQIDEWQGRKVKTGQLGIHLIVYRIE